MERFNSVWLLRKRQSRSLTGREPLVFRIVLERLRPLRRASIVKPKNRSGRPWGIDGIEDHLLMLLILYRCAVAQDFLGMLSG